MNSEEMTQTERELLDPTFQEVIRVPTPQGVLIFTRWKKFSTLVSLDKGAEISIPNTRSTLRIQPRDRRTAVLTAPKTSMSVTVFTFDAKKSHGVQDDEFVSDLIKLSLPPGLSDDDVRIEMCHEHGLALDPMTPTTSASKVVFYYQPHTLARTEHPIKFGQKIAFDRAGKQKFEALLQSFFVKVVVSLPAPPARAFAAVGSGFLASVATAAVVVPVAAVVAAAVALSSKKNVSLSFFTYFYGVGRQASSFHALSFEKIKILDGWQFDLCIISTRPEHRDRYLAYRMHGRGQPLLLDRKVNNHLLSHSESTVVEAGDIQGWINESRVKRKYITTQQLLAARDSPIDAWVHTFHFAYNRRKILQRLPEMTAYVTIVSGDRSQCLRIQSSASSSVRDRVEDARKPSPSLARVEPSREIALQYNPSHLEMKDLTFHMLSQWRDVARCIVPVFTNSEIEHIELHEREDQPLRFLQAWIEKHGLDATRESLCAALMSVGLTSSAKEVFPEIYEKMTKEEVLNSSVQVEQSELDYDEARDFLGGGACGEVFKATLKKSGKPEKTVAVKAFKDFTRRTRTEKEYELFKKEAAILLQMNENPFILRLIGLCAVPTFYALVTEFISGGDLSSLLKSHEHRAEVDKWETRVTFAKQIARGMLHLHSNQPPVIHYNLKSQNVLVECIQYNDDVQFFCKVSDFGLSKLARVRSNPAGTVAHIAPERYSSRHGVDDRDLIRDLEKKSDVYSYGVVLWEIREKERPYKDMPNDLISLHVKSGRELPRGRAANDPPLFNNLLNKCVKFKPQDRPTFREAFLRMVEAEKIGHFLIFRSIMTRPYNAAALCQSIGLV